MIMNTTIRKFTYFLTACLLGCSIGWSQRGPQDTWYVSGERTLPNNCDPYDIIATPEGTLLITDAYRDKIAELNESGAVIKWIGSRGTGNGQFTDPAELAIGPNNRIYVADTNNHRIQILERNGTFVKSFGTNGTGDGQFNKPRGLAISSDNEVFVSEDGNHRIQVFDANGTFLRKWGSQGILDGQFNRPLSLDIDKRGNIFIADFVNRRVQVFSEAGQFLYKFLTNKAYAAGGASFIKLLSSGIISTGHENDGYNKTQNQLRLREKNGDLIKKIAYDSTSGSSSTGIFSPSTQFSNGTIVFADRYSKVIRFLTQTYRSIRPNPSKDAPLPEVISVTQPAGTNHLEVKYRITDADSAKVKAGLLAFKDGGNDLTKVIVPKTFVGSVAGKLDENTTTGVVHTVTWDAKADWGVTYGNVEVAVVAQDDRDLMNFHFLTLPGTETSSSGLKISRSPVNNPDFLNAWYTLLALGDEGIVWSSDSNIKGSPSVPQIDGNFTPSDLSGLTMWLDAKDIDGDGNTDSLAEDSNISNWCDKAGGDHNATGNTPPLYKITALNSRPSVKFNKLSGWLSFPEISTIRTVFWVYEGAPGHLLGHTSNYHFHTNGLTSLWSPQYASGSVRGGRAYLLGNQVSPTTERFPSNTPIVLSIVTTGNTKANLIGKERSSGGHSGYLSELLIFSRALDENEQFLVDQYLANKWGISESLIFASAASTTTNGRNYLFDKMNLREATTAEVTRAKEAAIPGSTNAFTPDFQVGPGERPVKVNEYGFDTGATSGYWVVPKN
jgi:hypothetical protein